MSGELWVQSYGKKKTLQNKNEFILQCRYLILLKISFLHKAKTAECDEYSIADYHT